MPPRRSLRQTGLDRPLARTRACQARRRSGLVRITDPPRLSLNPMRPAQKHGSQHGRASSRRMRACLVSRVVTPHEHPKEQALTPTSPAQMSGRLQIEATRIGTSLKTLVAPHHGTSHHLHLVRLLCRLRRLRHIVLARILCDRLGAGRKSRVSRCHTQKAPECGRRTAHSLARRRSSSVSRPTA